jgi:hypothetical protein
MANAPLGSIAPVLSAAVTENMRNFLTAVPAGGARVKFCSRFVA